MGAEDGMRAKIGHPFMADWARQARSGRAQ